MTKFCVGSVVFAVLDWLLFAAIYFWLKNLEFAIYVTVGLFLSRAARRTDMAQTILGAGLIFGGLYHFTNYWQYIGLIFLGLVIWIEACEHAKEIETSLGLPRRFVHVLMGIPWGAGAIISLLVCVRHWVKNRQHASAG